MKEFFNKFLKVINAKAHCDIPCGVYEPVIAKIAAKTVLRMMIQLKELKPPADVDQNSSFKLYLNEFGRRVSVKEEHAEICKKELRILWGDFFKEEHLQKYPDLHNLFWKAMKLASKCKQSIDETLAEDLCQVVDQIAKIFYEVKGDPKRYEAYLEITEKLF
ncbi:MAG: superoxide dismutase, Ni [Candidatus Aenigmatarchaeota archaeon]